ncbi:MAG: hypothetical protein KKB81_03755 [Candidatus Margulisbacteria bacterium]|nr:hypothetical protein [Candidatus Margulisiibacteriota bacterium]MBU1021680.1 hypothetical protein [Candidatus Margulisiibacteriota bacterium]MBU1729558.1 hypothetical protein [Candidatus Margulisiibacteriota bacterium]MBU1955044.1 hypothetical protein [Candidatus Margulisiibacteriota bacterium]
MKKLINIGLTVLLVLAISSVIAYAQMTFFLIDNFEDGDYTRNPEWWKFDNITLEVKDNPKTEKIDFVAESCGTKSLNITGKAKNWYAGGFGTNVTIDASEYTRIQFDLYGNDKLGGKVKVELYEDDNNNNVLEQDSKRGWIATDDDKWVAEVKVLGDGFTRISIPFSAFADENPGMGDDTWNPNKVDKSGGLLKVQFIIVSDDEAGDMDLSVDNVLLTY